MMLKEKINNIFFIIFLPLYYLLFFISGIFPRNKKLWVFGSWNGKRFADNAKWLFIYCHSNKSSDTKYIWISKTRSIVEELKLGGYHSAYFYSIKGLWYSLRAGVYIFDTFSKDISYWTSRKAKKILLFHGIPLKKIGRDIDNKNNYLYKCYHGTPFQKLAFKIIRPWWVEKYHLIPSTATYTSEKFKTAFALTDNEVPITGFSRNDILYSPDELVGSVINKEYIERKYRRIIIYMPTFRDSNRVNRKIPLNWELLNALLEEKDSLFLLKLHPNEKFEIDTSKYNHIRLLDKNIDVYQLLRSVDLLITDYSSVALDFIGTHKPVLFYPYDLPDYISNDRSLYIDFNEFFSNVPLVKSFEQLYHYLDDYLNNEIIDFGNLPGLLKQFQAYTDSRASERIKAEIEKRYF